MTNEAIEAAEWECFSDPAYYDMWCVRQVGSRTFGEGFHLVNGDEAKMLCRFLNARSFPSAALMEEGARLALEAAAELITPGRIEHSHHTGCSCVYCEGWRDVHAIQSLDPATIVKGAGHA